MPVPSPDVKRGGLCVGVAPLPRKKEPVTETLTKEKSNGRRINVPQETGSRTVVSETHMGIANPRTDIIFFVQKQLEEWADGMCGPSIRRGN